MPATSYDLTGEKRLEAGATYDVIIPFTLPNGDPLDLTDYDPNGTGTGGRLMFRRTIDEVDGAGIPVAPILSLTPQLTALVEGVYIVEPPTLGKVRIFVLPATLEALSFAGGVALTDNRSGVFDLEVEGASVADVLRLAEGSYAISPEATR